MLDLVRITEGSEESWGKLVKTWATGKSYFDTVSIDKLPVPRTIEELVAQCKLPGVNVDIKIPDYVKGLAVLQHSRETLAIRLPSKKMVEDAEAALAKPDGSYSLPSFYKAFCGPLHGAETAEKRKLLQALRIGDYSISNCQ